MQSSVKRFILLLSGLLLMLTQLMSQPAVSIGRYGLCDEVELLVPLQVSAFMDVAAFSFFMQYDSTALSISGITAVHPKVAEGQLISNINNAQSLNISWFGNEALFLEDDTLLLIRVQARKPIAALTFESNSELALSDYSVVTDVAYEDGTFLLIPSLIPQPEQQEVVAGASVSFELPELKQATYQWQVKQHDGWINLVEGSTVQGVNEPELLLSNVGPASASYAYRCLVNSHNCAAPTQSATLVIDLTGLKEKSDASMQVMPNPVDEQLFFVCSKPLNNAMLTLSNMDGRIARQRDYAQLRQDVKSSFSLAGLCQGVYVLQLFDGRQLIATERVIKN